MSIVRRRLRLMKHGIVADFDARDMLEHSGLDSDLCMVHNKPTGTQDMIVV